MDIIIDLGISQTMLTNTQKWFDVPNLDVSTLRLRTASARSPFDMRKRGCTQFDAIADYQKAASLYLEQNDTDAHKFILQEIQKL